MACINPDGTLTEVARRVLTALDRPLAVERLAAAAALPIYRVRATLRETGRAKLVEAVAAGPPELWQVTALGREALELDSP